MKEPIKIYAVEVFNLNTTAMFCGEPVPKGCLGVTLSRHPEFLYRKIGRCFVAEDGGLISCFQHSPGTTEGFGGRAITLPVIGQGAVFKNKGVTRMTFSGSLWDTVDARRAAENLIGETVRSIGIRCGNDRVYFSARATESFLNRLSRVLVMGEPEQSPLI